MKAIDLRMPLDEGNELKKATQSFGPLLSFSVGLVRPAVRSWQMDSLCLWLFGCFQQHSARCADSNACSGEARSEEHVQLHKENATRVMLQFKVVKFLGSPGFCNLEAPGFRQPAITFPDLSGTDGITIAMDQTLEDGLTNWDVSIQTETSKKASRTGDAGWQADFKFKSGQTSYFLPYSAFTCSSRGRKVSNCGQLSQQLSELTQLGVGSAGVAGPFRVELSSIEATSTRAEIKLATFDDTKETTLSWKKTTDLRMTDLASPHENY